VTRITRSVRSMHDVSHDVDHLVLFAVTGVGFSFSSTTIRQPLVRPDPGASTARLATA
jgi:hypothetical protein